MQHNIDLSHPKIKYFMIDAGNVYLLADHDITVHALKEAYALSFPIREINSLVHGPEEELFAAGRLSVVDYFIAVSQKLGISGKADYESFKAMHNMHVFGVDMNFMNLLELLESKIGNSCIAVVTQTHEWQTERENYLFNEYCLQGMEERFPGRVFRSHALRASKKSGQFWDHVIRTTGFALEKTILVDDNSSNIGAWLDYAPGGKYFRYSPNDSRAFAGFLKDLLPK